MSEPHKKMVALIADQDEEFRLMLRKILEESGANVEAVANGNQAVALCSGIQPDIIFLQVNLPELNGFNTCERIRKLPNGKSVPIILIAEMDDGVTEPVSLAVGATGCIVKPLDWLLLSCRIIVAYRTYCGKDEKTSSFKSRQTVTARESDMEDTELMALTQKMQLKRVSR